ncbi:MAG: hypothetical protein HOB20_05650, partial [Planctomycetaceae bacterium]|nr:hypothetical protein [Planctomycetaceae bacterium]
MNQAPTLHSNHQEIKVMPTRLFMVTAILSGLTTLSSAADWPQFRGANSAGHADSAAVATNFGPGMNERWNVAVASGHSSPCIIDDQIILTGTQKDINELQIFSLERS